MDPLQPHFLLGEEEEDEVGLSLSDPDHDDEVWGMSLATAAAALSSILWRHVSEGPTGTQLGALDRTAAVLDLGSPDLIRLTNQITTLRRVTPFTRAPGGGFSRASAGGGTLLGRCPSRETLPAVSPLPLSHGNARLGPGSPAPGRLLLQPLIPSSLPPPPPPPPSPRRSVLPRPSLYITCITPPSLGSGHY
ncbi:hypothetical protein NHX12_030550 [Muraenolepis orangiensis]|uniref:Uncharacterized protein n=1 Tax=Muraenolepis orangiensis TaxID=630683 RepID=A0A9Q0IJH4_9TELE|nr:hypothetical protein NHX12_030550 [Muraenolepis orangiensis]